MVPILTLIFVIALSMFITKAGTLALMHTGMSRERSRFQSRSAFSGAGFTTNESELVVKHPVRRRIITVLILMGNAGVVTAISSLILSFVGQEANTNEMRNIYLLIFGIAFLYFATQSKRLDKFLEKIINKMLKEFTDIKPRKFSRLMTVMEDYEVSEVKARENDWMRNHTLGDLKLVDEGLLVLGILREDGMYIGIPRGRYEVEEGDTLVIYGKADRMAALSKREDRLSGKQEHRETVKEHEEEMQEQDDKVES